MSGIVQKKELQEDGHYQVSLYDTETQKLTHRWFETQDGKKDGEEIEFNYTGKVHRVTDWKNGKKDGIEICFNTGISVEDLEKTKSRCNKGDYKAFGDKVLDGDCSFKKECSYKEGVLDGDYTETRERMRPHEAYRNGIKEKIEIKCQYKNGELDGIYEEVKQPAEDVEYQYRYKYENTFEYKDGVLDGVYINEEERVSTHYKEGKLDGKYVKFSSKNNQKETEKEYKDGKLNGICIEYDEYGFKTVESTYKNDVLDGPYKEYFRNGKPKCEGSYSNGEKNGFWKTYADNGDLIEMRRFENGKDVTERYNKLKKIASKRIDKEKAIEAETGVKTRLPKMSKGAKVVAMVKESLGLSK